jgi:glycosyltransferase involved in cell wall biosynthesis
LAYSVVEPLLAGVPVVSTDAGGIPDLIRDGDTGWLVSPGNPEALARAVLEALSNPKEARRRTDRGAEAVRHLLDLEKTGRELAAIYEKILKPTKLTKSAPCFEPFEHGPVLRNDAVVMHSRAPRTES